MFGRMEMEGGGLEVSTRREILPGNVVPTHYNLVLEPDFKTFTFEGTVTIDVDVVEDSSSISLNTVELDIHSTKILSESQEVNASPDVTYDKKLQTTKVNFKETLKKDSKAQLQMRFTGQLNDKMAGFYRSTYKNADGVDSVMAASQMEATDARRAFPCFDEPALKAEFTITLIAEKHLTCLSNMDVALEKEMRSELSGITKNVVKFNKTPKMSTYLVGLIVGELNYIKTDKYRVPVRVFAPSGVNIDHCNFSLDLAGRTLEFYEKTFGIKYPLPKLDLVAIPDFASGAMENWGLITFRQVYLLFDEKTNGVQTKERVAELVQHEIAHQWFGNLVTMDFWDGLWLNEGFATWMSWYSCNVFYPEWKVWQTYVTDTLQDALAMDSLRSSHPIDVPIHRAEDVNQIFDDISYAKSSCVIRMISKYLGEDSFMEGIRQYLKKHAYDNTKTRDLWAALSAVSGKDVEKVMDVWTTYVGHPVLAVTEDSANKNIHVKQNRLLRTADVRPEEDKTLYPAFLGLRTKDGIDEELILTEREGVYQVPDTNFFKVNAEHTNFYRTSYSPALLEKLGRAAKDGLLGTEDRAGMIADAGALAACGYQKTSGFLNVIKGFRDEPDYVVWDVITSKLASVRQSWMFEDQATKNGLKKFQLELTSDKARALGWEFMDGEDHRQQQLKSLLFGVAGTAGDEMILKAAKAMFAEFTAANRSAIHPNLRSSVFGIVLESGGEAEYNSILEIIRTSKSSDEHNTALRSLGRSSDPKLIERTLTFALTKDEVKEQDMYLVISGLRNHPQGITALFDWMVENWQTICERFPPGSMLLPTIVQMCSASLTRDSDVKRVEDFFEGKDRGGIEQGIAQALDAIRAKSAWVKRDGEDVKRWVKECLA